MADYRYSLIRYVPDMQRMEPSNVGVILQGCGRLDVKLSPHAAKRGDIDTAVFQQWRDFFHAEIKQDAIPLFQPPKTSEQFFRYLRGLCEDTVVLSETLFYQSADRFDQVLEQLYDRLVAPPRSTDSLPSNRPSGRFRDIAEEKGFLRRGMKRHAHLFVNNQRLWMPYRQIHNDSIWAIDKVEINTQIGQTANEIERLPTIQQHLATFLGSKSRANPKYYVLADQFERPFSSQDDSEFEAMRDDLERSLECLQKDGANVVRNVEDVEKLATEIDKHLEPPCEADEKAAIADGA